MFFIEQLYPPSEKQKKGTEDPSTKLPQYQKNAKRIEVICQWQVDELRSIIFILRVINPKSLNTNLVYANSSIIYCKRTKCIMYLSLSPI